MSLQQSSTISRKSVEKLIKEMTADHLVDGILLSPLQELVPNEATGLSIPDGMSGDKDLQPAMEKLKMGARDWHENEKKSTLFMGAQAKKAVSLSQNTIVIKSADMKRLNEAERKLSQKRDANASYFNSHDSEEKRVNPDTSVQEKFRQGLKLRINVVKDGCYVFVDKKNDECKDAENRIFSTLSESCAHVEQLRKGKHLPECSQEVPHSKFKVASKESKCLTMVKNHKKSDTKHVGKRVLGTPHMSAQDDMTRVQEDLKVISNTQSIRSGPDPPINSVLSTPATAAPIIKVVKQDWVCCDKCQKWRLLPPGVGSAQLPEKWTCKLIYWLPGLNKCNVPEDTTTQAVEPQYDASHFEQSKEPGRSQFIPSLSQHRGRSQGIEKPRTELGKQHKLNSGSKENEPMTASMQTILPPRIKKTQTWASNAFTEKGHLIDMMVKKDSLIEIEKMVNIEDRRKAKCPQENNGFALSEATNLKQQALRLQGNDPIERKALGTYMKAALRFFQAAALIESGGATSSNEELLVKIYIEAASVTKLCADAYERSAELASAILAHKCMASAYMNLVQLIGLRDADKLHLLQQPDTSVGNVVIPQEAYSTYEHVMDYVDLTNAAMESSRKSHSLFTTIKETFCLDADVLVSLKRVLDFDLHNVGGLRQLVIETMELLKH